MVEKMIKGKDSEKYGIFILIVIAMIAVLPYAASRSFVVYNTSNMAETYFVVNGSNGFIGIGKAYPNFLVDVAGGINASSLNITGGNIRVSTLTSCTALETDASGNFVCGTDDTGVSGDTAWDLSNFTSAYGSRGSSRFDNENFTARIGALGEGSLPDGIIVSADIKEGVISADNLATNSVKDSEIDYTAVTLSDFTDDVGYQKEGSAWELSNFTSAYNSALATNISNSDLITPANTTWAIKAVNDSINGYYNHSIDLSGYAKTEDIAAASGTMNSTSWNLSNNVVMLSDQTDNVTVASDVFHIDTTNGRVGIGTASPTAKLDVNGSINITSDRPTISLRGVTQDIPSIETEKGLAIILNSIGTETENNDFIIMNESSSGKQYLKLDGATGNVGIGTSSPSVLLDIQTNTTGASDVFQFRENGGNIVGRFRVDDDGDGVLLLENSSSDNKVLIYANGDSYFNGGNIGIGTIAPSTKLEVDGGFKATGNSYVEGALSVGDDTSGNILIKGGSGTSSQVRFYDEGTERARIGVPTGQTYLSLSGSASLTADMAITSTGNVGIGTTSPTQKLTVDGDVNITGDLYVSENSVYIGDTALSNNGGTLEWDGSSVSSTECSSSSCSLHSSTTHNGNTLITSANIGSQSVNYATTAGSASLSIEVKTANVGSSSWATATCSSGKSIIYGMKGDIQNCYNSPSRCNEYCTPGDSSCSVFGDYSDGGGVYIVCGNI